MKIAFFKGIQPGFGPALFDHLVHWWCAGPYSHCAIVVGANPDGTTTIASSTFLGGGVGYQSVTLDPANWDVLDAPGDLEAAKAWIEAHEGQGYDVIGLLRYVGPRGDGEKRKWYCSEAVCAALGWDEPWRFDPNSFASVLRNLSSVEAAR